MPNNESVLKLPDFSNDNIAADDGINEIQRKWISTVNSLANEIVDEISTGYVCSTEEARAILRAGVATLEEAVKLLRQGMSAPRMYQKEIAELVE